MNQTNSKRELGRWGEDLASAFLREKGFLILERNVHTPYGEIDLMAKQGGSIIFIEVKTRSSDAFGFPEQSITKTKREHLIAAADHIMGSRMEGEADWRIDVIAIRRLRPDQEPEILHFENAVYGD
jgi:putative endonuclease